MKETQIFMSTIKCKLNRCISTFCLFEKANQTNCNNNTITIAAVAAAVVAATAAKTTTTKKYNNDGIQQQQQQQKMEDEESNINEIDGDHYYSWAKTMGFFFCDSSEYSETNSPE